MSSPPTSSPPSTGGGGGGKKSTPSTPRTNNGSRSSSRNRNNNTPKSPDPNAATTAEKDKKPGSPSHQRKQSGRGGRRGSHGSAGRGGGTTTPPNSQGQQGGEGMTNLKNIISEMSTSNNNALNGSSPQNPNQGGASSPSPSRTKPTLGSAAHRKTSSSGAAPSTTNNSSSSTNPSTLNPNAGGFQPNSLGSISDMIDEGLVTPTASHFDLMTGRPSYPSPPIPHVGGFRGQGWGGGGELPEEVPGFGGVPGTNARAFAFPPNPAMQQAQAQAAQQQQLLLLQAQQQQQFQMQQLAAMGAGVGVGVAFQPQTQQVVGGAGAGAGAGQASAQELMAEQLAIQQQLENLRIQQENLLARFGDMQAMAAAGVSSPVLSQVPEAVSSPRVGGGHQPASSVSSVGGGGGGHRRIHSQQQQVGGGVMGSFGAGGMGGFGAGFGSPTQDRTLPKGHGRRHSVNTSKNATSPNPNQSPSMGQQPTMGGFGALGGGFQFPPPQPGGAQQGQQQRTDQPLGEAEFSASGGGSNFRHSHHRTQSGSISSLGGWSLHGNNTHVAGQANLSDAQAHLQQLTQYRASAGHSRLPSFGMSTGGPGQLAMANYGGGIPQQGQGQPVRKSLFAPYLPQASIPPLLAAGKLVIGVLRVNKRNRSDAYVATDVLDSDIYVCGSKDRNRALEGDIVAVELLDVDEVWGTKKEKEEKKRKKEENASYDPRASRDLRKSDKKKDDIEVEGQAPGLFEDEEVNDDQKPQFAGHVVAVVERAPGQLFSGMLGVLRPSSAATQQKQDAERREREGVDLRNNQPKEAPRIIWFRPTDKRVPLIAIPTEQAPEDFIDRPDKYSERLFVACIKRWPITSLHPFGTLVEELGSIGDIETETSALLKDCNFSAEDFSESVVKCLPPTPWTIPERELNPEVRRDFRENRVFSIDPATARDLDDALHIVKNEDGTYEVGVHIADVTHFVKPNTALDREARKRATTVYLTQRAVPMLPQILSEELCSLTAGQDKLTFSVVFTMSDDGKVLSTWFGKTIINTVGKLAYGDAQEVLEGRSLPEGKIREGIDAKDVESDIKELGALAKQIRKRRFDNGALRIDNVKVWFTLNEDGLPEDCRVDDRKESNELIEEFMLLANMSVAGKIAAGLPDQALLRRHEPPIERRLEAFVERMGRLNLELDGSSSGTLMSTINKITDPNARTTLQHLSTKSMNRAKYFCAGVLDISKYHHYALNVPLYTHFTSPIRRYADILVHRQLEAVLLGNHDVKFTLDTESVAKVAQTCNTKKEAARLAQEQSTHLFLCVLINDLTQRYGPVIRPATVIGVLDEAFDVLVTEFGIEKRVHADNIPIENHVYDEHSNSLQLYWKKGVDTLRWLAESNKDEHLLRIRNRTEHHAKMMQTTSDAAQAESALFDDDDDEEPIPTSSAPSSSSQHNKSKADKPLVFEEAEKTSNGHYVQTIRELQTTHVVITADMTKSPPVLKVLAVNPWAEEK
ncbi:RNB-domain-containing protein [Meredithblackwellia eburnea MCA 4105]